MKSGLRHHFYSYQLVAKIVVNVPCNPVSFLGLCIQFDLCSIVEKPPSGCFQLFVLICELVVQQLGTITPVG
ncbi:hypothetical protein D3C85_1847590 [compost metagenome]